jgi:DNA modification methylase
VHLRAHQPTGTDTCWTWTCHTTADVPPIQPGDIWIFGHHRLCCGDSTSASAVAALMQADRAALCFTSPPYGQQRDYGAAKAQVSDWDGLMQGVFARLAEVMTPEGQVLVNLGLIHRDNEWQPYWSGWIDWMRQQGWRRFGWYVWDQGAGMMGDWAGRLAPCFEFVFHFNREARQPNKIIPKKPESIYDKTGEGGVRDPDGYIPTVNSGKLSLQTHKIPDNVIRVNRHSGTIGDGISHPAVFPIALPEFLMQSYTDPGEIVYEPFSGSGTSLLAGERCGRVVRAMELDPAYVDVACKRWRQAGYPPAVHAVTGEEFPDE